MMDLDLKLSTDPNTPILEIEDLNISFYTRKGEIPAVMDFSMTVMSGETMGLVGESGCASPLSASASCSISVTTVRSSPARSSSWAGTCRRSPGKNCARSADRAFRWLYQEPMASLNPAMKIGKQLNEVLTLHEGLSEEDASKRSASMLDAVRSARPGPDHGRLSAPAIGRSATAPS